MRLAPPPPPPLPSPQYEATLVYLLFSVIQTLCTPRTNEKERMRVCTYGRVYRPSASPLAKQANIRPDESYCRKPSKCLTTQNTCVCMYVPHARNDLVIKTPRVPKRAGQKRVSNKRLRTRPFPFRSAYICIIEERTIAAQPC